MSKELNKTYSGKFLYSNLWQYINLKLIVTYLIFLHKILLLPCDILNKKLPKLIHTINWPKVMWERSKLLMRAKTTIQLHFLQLFSVIKYSSVWKLFIKKLENNILTVLIIINRRIQGEMCCDCNIIQSIHLLAYRRRVPLYSCGKK